ncbi:hypothetical protein AVEN_184758-1 [Araneus ventricosus]|uniref:Uncharacterized protein n=1 Tax=Araneus ventricosus TaxID=182803 RepID=A0A4Y2KVN7_ARAVE|nr:hypothetical protein AVEN_184758-1 [Araneus ventricosus]
MPSRARVYKRRQPKRRRLWSFVCSASWKAVELSAIESAPTIIISDLLTVCVAKSQRAVTVITTVKSSNLDPLKKRKEKYPERKYASKRMFFPGRGKFRMDKYYGMEKVSHNTLSSVLCGHKRLIGFSIKEDWLE